jgi:hypothetical protein
MKIQPIRKEKLILCIVILFLSIIPATAILVSCGGGGGGGSNGISTGTVTTTITDPPVCLSPNGPFKNAWVTITRVRAHTSSDANSGDGGWVDLVDLRNNPRQIDLLSLASTTCLLTQLGSTSGIPTGKYQQIRLYLLSNSPSGEATPSPNHCGANGFNCVVLEDNSIQTLLLSSESQTGIKIPPGQISGGGLTVAADQTVDLNIDFDACTSIVQQGNGQYRLKPTLRAGEISINTSTISGRVIDKNTSLPIPNAFVLLETRDPIDAGIDRVVAQTLTGSDGTFIFCSLPQGPYDVVADAQTTSTNTTYNATVTLQVPLGRDMGDIPLVPEPGNALPAKIAGQVTTSTGSAATSADIEMSALQSVTVDSITVRVVIPLFAGSTPTFATQSLGCTPNNDCAAFTLNVPAGNPQAGVFNVSAPTSYTTQAGGNYSVEAQAFIPMSGGLQDCSPSDQIVPNVIVASGATSTLNAPIAFTGCQ